MLMIVVAVYLVIQMTLVWGIYTRINNPTVVDVAWPIGILASGLIYLLATPLTHRTLLIAALLTFWSIRLAGYLYWTRIRNGIIDKRYTELASRWKISPELGYLLNFQFQGLLIFLLTLVFMLSTNNQPISIFDYLAAAIIIISIIGEWMADWQLQRFKKSHANQVCNVGLWHLSRHPNYFFNWAMWCGFAIFAIPQPYGGIGLISPLLMYIIFNYITGPITEKGSVTSHGQAYLDYQKETPKFFPKFS